VLTYGGGAGAALAEQGHSYMPVLYALAVLLLGLAAARFCRSLARALRGVVPARPEPSFCRSWAGATAALVVLYTLQEGFEGSFAPGHPSGLIGIFGNGGWTALLLSLAVGALIAAIGLLGRHTIALVVARAARRRPRRTAFRPTWTVVAGVLRPRPALLGLHLAGRAPPA
jgi:hypothetical protein